MTGPLLEIRNLSVTLNADGTPVRVVNDTSLTVERGRTLGIVGESGSGKSMTAFAIMRLLPPGARIDGSIRLEGQEITALSERQMCSLRGGRIGMIFQEPMTALNPAHTIARQVAEGLRLHQGLGMRAARSEAADLLDLVGIPRARDRLDDYPHQFSGGQRQRVAIAMALACKPALLIADEPTTALDVTVQKQILDLLADLQARLGMAMILISHDLGVIGYLADQVMVMRHGDVVEQGAVTQIFDAPAAAYTRDLFAAVPRLDPVAGGPT